MPTELSIKRKEKRIHDEQRRQDADRLARLFIVDLPKLPIFRRPHPARGFLWCLRTDKGEQVIGYGGFEHWLIEWLHDQFRRDVQAGIGETLGIGEGKRLYARCTSWALMRRVSRVVHDLLDREAKKADAKPQNEEGQP